MIPSGCGAVAWNHIPLGPWKMRLSKKKKKRRIIEKEEEKGKYHRGKKVQVNRTNKNAGSTGLKGQMKSP